MSSKGIQLTSIADSRSNTYTVDATVNHATTSMTPSSDPANVSTPLLAGDTITATFSANLYSTRAIAAVDFKGIAATNRVDQVVTQTGSSSAPNTPFTANTAQNDELLSPASASRHTREHLYPGQRLHGAHTRQRHRGIRHAVAPALLQDRLRHQPVPRSATLSGATFWTNALVTYRAATDNDSGARRGRGRHGQSGRTLRLAARRRPRCDAADGGVLVWDGFGAAVNSERVWDPVTATFSSSGSGVNFSAPATSHCPTARRSSWVAMSRPTSASTTRRSSIQRRRPGRPAPR